MAEPVAEPMRPGRLLVVGTPIGNLGDLSPRAADALRSADLVVAEDTRLAARLLAHLGERRPTRSFNEHNATARLPELLARLERGETLALTTDAGMPAVSDPGASLVAAARAAGASVAVVPGPSAVTAAVALSGVEAAGFVFGGFLPARPASVRRTALDGLLDAATASRLVLVLFEAPHRLRDLLGLLAERVPSAGVAVCRELTKLHEEVLRGTPKELLGRVGEPRGELVVVIDVAAGAPPAADRDAAPTGRRPVDAEQVVAAALAAGIGVRSTVELLRGIGVDRRTAYRLAQAKPAVSER